jgi:hypothetical protein
VKQQYTAWSIFSVAEIAGAGDELQELSAESWKWQMQL